MKVDDIRTIEDAQRYVEGCLNDLENGITTKEETLSYLGEYTMYLMKYFYERTIEKIKANPELLK